MSLLPMARSTDPFNRLPYEIWLDCLQLTIGQSAAGPLPYIAVSSSWSAAILDSPSLWISIVITDTEDEDEDARIHVFMHLSQSLPVDIICVNANDRRILWQFLHNYPSRLRSFVCSTRELSTNPISTLVQALKETPLLFPTMQVLIVQVPESVPTEVLAAWPNLRVIRGCQVSTNDESYLGTDIEEAEFLMNEPTDIDKIIKRRRMHTLGIKIPQTTPDSSKMDGRDTVWQPMIMRQLAEGMGTQLKKLSMDIPLQAFWVFVNHLYFFPNLRFLALHLRIPEADIDYAGVAYPAFKNIRTLKLTMGNDQPPGRIQSEVHKPATSVLRSFTVGGALQDLDTLHFHSVNIGLSEYDLGSFLQSAVNVRILSAQSLSMIRGPDPSPPYTSPPMRYLQSLSLKPVELFGLIDTPQLSDLKLRHFVLDTESSNYPGEKLFFGSQIIQLDIPTEVFDAITRNNDQPLQWMTEKTLERLIVTNRCPQILTAHFETDRYHEHRAFLERLREISFHTTNRFNHENAQEANRFIYLLYRFPESCPQLRIIKILGYPSWELLFEALRRRNLSRAVNITQISLPGLPVPGILHRLVGLLGGSSGFHSTRDIDEVISRRLINENIHACGNCVRAGYVQCPRLPIQKSAIIKTSDPEYQDILDLDFPPSHDESIAHYAFKDWKDHQELPQQENYHRWGGMCYWQYYYVWTEITEYTLEGTSLPPWLR